MRLFNTSQLLPEFCVFKDVIFPCYRSCVLWKRKEFRCILTLSTIFNRQYLVDICRKSEVFWNAIVTMKNYNKSNIFRMLLKKGGCACYIPLLILKGFEFVEIFKILYCCNFRSGCINKRLAVQKIDEAIIGNTRKIL